MGLATVRLRDAPCEPRGDGATGRECVDDPFRRADGDAATEALLMPAKSKKQQRFMGAELNRARQGKKTRTGMGKKKLAKMASKPKGGYKKRGK